MVIDKLGVEMRSASLLIAVFIAAPLFMLGICELGLPSSIARAQIGGAPGAPVAPNPPPSAIAPPAVGAPSLLGLPPAPPGAPAAFATPAAIPQLNPAPAAPLASLEVGAPTPRVFSCSCGGPGFPTQWVGNVSSTTFLLASQAASSACTAYKTNAHAASPYITPPSFGFTTPPSAPTSPYLVGNAIPFTSSIGLQPGATQPKRINSLLTTENCSRCACD